MSKGKKNFCHYLWNYLGSISCSCWNGSKNFYWDVSKSMDKTYETVERSKKSQVNLNNKEPFFLFYY